MLNGAKIHLVFGKDHGGFSVFVSLNAVREEHLECHAFEEFFPNMCSHEKCQMKTIYEGKLYVKFC